MAAHFDTYTKQSLRTYHTKNIEKIEPNIVVEPGTTFHLHTWLEIISRQC